MVDQGTEFKGAVTDLMKDHGVHIQHGEPKNHRAQAFVGRANRTLTERLYSRQYAQKFLMFKVNETWKRRLREVVQALNSEPRRILANEAPMDVLDEDKVSLKERTYKRLVGIDEKMLLPQVIVRYLYQPGEGEGDERRRATDPIWSLEVLK